MSEVKVLAPYWFPMGPLSLAVDDWVLPMYVFTWSSLCVCQCPNPLLQGHQSCGVRTHHNDLTLPPKTVTC
jgi:hypothetical protein